MDNLTNQFYDALAEFYPRFFKDWTVQLEREYLTFRALFRGKQINRVLDAACGTGTQSVPMAQLGVQVVAADPSASMLAKAKELAQERNVLNQITFKCVDFLNLKKVVEGPFDAIVCKGNSLPHLITDAEIETTLHHFFDLLRPGGMVIIGMRDFDQLLEHRPRFMPGLLHDVGDSEEFITFDIWDWDDGPPIIATQNLYITRGKNPDYVTIKRTVRFRPLSLDEVKVVLLEVGFVDISQSPDRYEDVLIAYKPV